MSLTELTGNPRHDQLLTLIADRGYMNIDELAQLLDVSTQTVRRDIRKLSEQGLITRHHGGAGRASSVVNTAFEQREVSLTEEKRAIAEAIADYIPDGSTIFITIGTTVEHVARALLNHNHLRIITNSLRVAHILYKNPRFEVMVPGGTLRPHNGGIIGPAADHTKYHASAAVEIGNVAQATALFTDELPGPALQNHLKSSKVEVVEVNSGEEQQAG